jgi:PTH1 family peptidyl-tRNA hydrolase
MRLKLVVGLGNPGDQYRETRHNAGADFVGALAHRYGVSLLAESRFFGLCGRIQAEGMDLRLLVPTTFMNRSGAAVVAMTNFFKIDPPEILVAHDELDFEAGVARLKDGGGHGGHNGLRDISRAIGDDYRRLRLGIGHPGVGRNVSSYVLGKPSAEERTLIDDSIEAASRVMPRLAPGDWAQAVQQLHTATRTSEENQDGN